MSLKERITEDMKAAMRAKDAERLGAIRMLLAACKQREIDERIELDDVAVIALVDKLIKQRRDSVAAFEQGADEVAAAVTAIVTALGASGPGDMGKVMGAAKAQLAGKADLGAVSAAVKQALSK